MTTPSIKPVKRAAKGHNRFCGPAALSIIAGIDTAEAAAVLRFVTRKRAITGTHDWQVIKALNLLGYRVQSAARVNPLKPKDNPTLASWLKSDERDGQGLYLIAAGNHWQVVQGRRYCCGLTKEIVSIRDEKVKRRARVTAAYRVEQSRKVALADVLPAKAKKADPERGVRQEAKRLAAAHGIEIEHERDAYGTNLLVWGPRWDSAFDEENIDPFYDDHYAEDWSDALERVREYVKVVTAHPEWVA